MDKATVVTLKNGVRVANFSSPHPFTFDDGTVLPKCSDERALGLKLELTERFSPHPDLEGVEDIKLSPVLVPAVEKAIDELENDPEVDVILIPLMVMQAVKDAGRDIGKCRVCRVPDRITKAVRSDGFCV